MSNKFEYPIVGLRDRWSCSRCQEAFWLKRILEEGDSGMKNRPKVNQKMEYHPPQKIAEQILKRIYPDKGFYTALGDFGEVYNAIRRESGLFRAHLWYWLQIIKSIPSLIRNVLYWRTTMFMNYIKIALRNIKKYKVYSLINISGL